ncbi:MAG TPA: PEP-CTERM sorting domain-containing protein, partial [Myxococcota bacterium]|nr:PEP-CTERM sorting domain-containing protein [Myxococcota bacterium]
MMMISSFAPSGATAQGILNHWLPPGEGDVYDAASWDQVSTDPVSGEFLLDDVRIENGGTAIAERTSPLRTDTGDELEVATLQVGSRVATTDPTESRGTLRLDDLDLRVLGDIHVGDDRWAATTYGVLNVQGGANAVGHVVLDGDFWIGGSTRAPAVTGVLGSIGADVHGEATIAGDLTTNARGDFGSLTYPQLQVGQGALAVGGDVNGFDRIRISGTAVESAVATVGGWIRVGAEATSENLVVGDAGPGQLDVGGGIEGFDVHVGVGDDGAGALTVGAGGIQTAPRVGSLAPGITVGSGLRATGVATVAGDVQARELTVGRRSGANGQLDVLGNLSVDGVDPLGDVVIGSNATPADPAQAAPAIGRVSVQGNGSARTVTVGTTMEITPFGWSADASADGVLSVQGDFHATRLEIGVVGRDGASATGRVEVGGDLDVSFATIGSNTSTASGGARADLASGTLVVGGTLQGVALGTGGFRARSTIAVGSIRSPDHGASGLVDVGGIAGAVDLIVVGSSQVTPGSQAELVVRSAGIHVEPVFASSSLQVGGGLSQPTIQGGSGLVDVTGGISGFSNIMVLNEGSQLISRSGAITADLLAVGDALNGHARLELRDSTADVGTFRLITGATLALDVASLSQYSAISADVATLAGTLELDFTSPVAQGHYDLIVATAVGGLSGDFADVLLSGAGAALAPGQYSTGVVQTVVGGVLTDVYRLTIVPEPGTALLLGLGLAGLGMRGRRR